tara:strand:- start:121 stop:426 length:306 start_codon:yes stop_codon:yes gene_type:complete
MPERPDIVDSEMLTFLDEYRKTHNVYTARPALKEAFGLNTPEASTVLSYWMRVYTSRNSTKALYPEGWTCTTCDRQFQDHMPESADKGKTICELCWLEAKA